MVYACNLGKPEDSSHDFDASTKGCACGSGTKREDPETDSDGTVYYHTFCEASGYCLGYQP